MCTPRRFPCSALRGYPSRFGSFTAHPSTTKKNKMCVDGDVDALSLAIIEQPKEIFYLNLLEGDLLLSLEPSNAARTSTTTSDYSWVGGGGGVAWNVSGLWPSSEEDEQAWTVFPSISPACCVTLYRASISTSNRRRTVYILFVCIHMQAQILGTCVSMLYLRCCCE